jgi:hypothetical protein
VPFALRLSGTGAAGITSSHAESGVSFAFADPELTVTLPFEFAGLEAGVIQRLTLPLGSRGSFAAHGGPRYAPVLSLTRAFGATLLAVEVGARLRSAERFGDVTFASEASGQLGVSHRFGRGFSMTVEGLVHPALTRDESSTETGLSTRIRRIPAELLATAQLEGDDGRLLLGVGTSLPLSERAEGDERETFAGPPGAPLFVTLRIDHVF